MHHAVFKGYLITNCSCFQGAMTDLNHLNNLNEMRGPGKCDVTLISTVIYRIWQINQQWRCTLWRA